MSHASPVLGGDVRQALSSSSTVGSHASVSSRPAMLPPAEPRAFAFLIEAEADPGFLPRLLTAVARLSLYPRRLQVDGAGEAGLLFVNMQLAGLSRQQAETMRDRVAGMVGVHQARLLPVPGSAVA